jgi:hypothetical protein
MSNDYILNILLNYIANYTEEKNILSNKSLFEKFNIISKTSVDDFKKLNTNFEFITNFNNIVYPKKINLDDLNNIFKLKIINCNFLTIKNLNLNLILQLWINKLINITNDNIGILIYALVKFDDAIENKMILLNKQENLIKFKNDLSVILSHEIKNNLIINNYKNYIYFKLREYFNLYFVKFQNDSIFFINSEVHELEKNNIEDFIKTLLFDIKIKIDLKYDIDCLFLTKNSYVYVYNNKLTYYGIPRILDNSYFNIKNIYRISKMEQFLKNN